MDLIKMVQENITLEVAYMAFLFLATMDLIAGVTKAWKKKDFRSRKMRDGLFQTLGDSMLIFICIVMGTLIPSLYLPILCFIIAMGFRELQSIAENLIEIGVRIPKKFVSGLKIYNEKFDEEIKEVLEETEQLK